MMKKSRGASITEVRREAVGEADSTDWLQRLLATVALKCLVCNKKI